MSDYGRIIIPAKFSNMDEGKFDLNRLLAVKLKEKKYEVLRDNSELYNPCELLTADVLNTSNMFTNKVRVEFKDCNQKIVAAFDGKSPIKEFHEGMQDALSKAVKGISPSNPVNQITTEISKPVETIAVSETAKPNLIPEGKTPNKAEVYTNGTLNLNKISLSENQFILANPNKSVPFAVFSATKKKDSFRVQLENGTTTFGYIENGNIIIEMSNSDGSFSKEIFSKK